MVPELAVRSCTLLFDTKVVCVHHFLVNIQHSFNCTTPDGNPTTVDKDIQLAKHLGTGSKKEGWGIKVLQNLHDFPGFVFQAVKSRKVQCDHLESCFHN